MKKAILAAEDERFYSHGGVDYISVFRAAATNLASGSQQGAGTITMQVARNFFLTREKTITRKLREVLLAWKIEANLSKDEILQLYLNQIFLGQRAYGFAAASQIYFGKPLKDVTPAEAAMLAGLPKAPSAFNPVTNPKRAKTRQLYVLRRMHDLRFLTDVQYKEAQTAPLAVRQGLREVRGDPRRVRRRDGAPSGFRRLRRGRVHPRPDRLHDHPQGRPGGRICRSASGSARLRPSARLPGAGGVREPSGCRAGVRTALERAFQEASDSEGLQPAVVLDASPTEVAAVLADGEEVKVAGDGLRFVARSLGDKAAPATRLRRGAVIRLARDDRQRWTIAQLPQAEAAFVAIRTLDGAIVSLVGGFDFDRNNNHVTQAQPQPGSSFKPFIYSAALEKGITPAP